MKEFATKQRGKIPDWLKRAIASERETLDLIIDPVQRRLAELRLDEIQDRVLAVEETQCKR